MMRYCGGTVFWVGALVGVAGWAAPGAVREYTIEEFLGTVGAMMRILARDGRSQRARWNTMPRAKRSPLTTRAMP